MSERQGIEIDYCPQCRGVWLDRGEFDKIIERSTSYQLGVSLMDKSGYNPIGAIEFWNRMKQGRQGKEPLVYLSTHPVDDKRIVEIEKILQNQHKQRQSI